MPALMSLMLLAGLRIRPCRSAAAISQCLRLQHAACALENECLTLQNVNKNQIGAMKTACLCRKWRRQ